jgi:perosamine synthetase
MKSSNSVYRDAVAKAFAFLKDADSVHSAYLRAIPIGKLGYLVPLCKGLQGLDGLMQDLTTWRNRFVHVYPTQFEASVQSTASWYANQLLNTTDRMLFLVVDLAGNRLGHIGFNSCDNDLGEFEIDNVVKASDACPKGMFSMALNTLINWARTTVNVESFYLRVMADNAHAISFYLKNDFIEFGRIPLAKKINGSTINYTEAKPGDVVEKTFVKMKYAPSPKKIGESLILTAGPSISAKESIYAYDAATYGWNSQWSKYLTKFENDFASYVGVRYALATSSCTGALQIALLALDIGPGDEVIVPDQTWVATANAVRYVGATPIFADIEIDTWNLDVNSVEKLISAKTKAIIPVHMYGHPARMDSLQQLAALHGLHIVEDAAPAIGAEWKGKRCGSFGSFAAFSFQGAKLMVTGEGGMLVTNDEVLYKKAMKIWDQGRNPSRTFWIDEHGVKYKMSNVQAALGLAQLERVDELIQMKRRIFQWYKEGLEGLGGIYLNEEVEHAKSIYWMSSIRLDEGCKLSRDEMIKSLRAHNIDSRPVFPAISQYPIWNRDLSPQPVANRVGLQAINLPSGVCLSRNEIMYVCQTIKTLL